MSASFARFFKKLNDQHLIEEMHEDDELLVEEDIPDGADELENVYDRKGLMVDHKKRTSPRDWRKSSK